VNSIIPWDAVQVVILLFNCYLWVLCKGLRQVPENLSHAETNFTLAGEGALFFNCVKKKKIRALLLILSPILFLSLNASFHTSIPTFKAWKMLLPDL